MSTSGTQAEGDEVPPPPPPPPGGENGEEEPPPPPATSGEEEPPPPPPPSSSGASGDAAQSKGESTGGSGPLTTDSAGGTGAAKEDGGEGEKGTESGEKKKVKKKKKSSTTASTTKKTKRKSSKATGESKTKEGDGEDGELDFSKLGRMNKSPMSRLSQKSRPETDGETFDVGVEKEIVEIRRGEEGQESTSEVVSREIVDKPEAEKQEEEHVVTNESTSEEAAAPQDTTAEENTGASQSETVTTTAPDNVTEDTTAATSNETRAGNDQSAPSTDHGEETTVGATTSTDDAGTAATENEKVNHETEETEETDKSNSGELEQPMENSQANDAGEKDESELVDGEQAGNAPAGSGDEESEEDSEEESEDEAEDKPKAKSAAQIAEEAGIPRFQEHAKMVPSQENEQRICVNDYEFLSLLGKGAYAEVILARHQPSGILTAIKCFSKSALTKKRNVHRDSDTGDLKVITALDKVENEVSILQKLDHPNVVGLLSAIDDPNSDDLYYVLEYADAGSLMKWDDEKSRYVVQHASIGTEDMSAPESLASFVVYDIASALKYCQSRGVVHRDIKPDNILLTSDGMAKLADFGVSFDRYGVDLETMTEQARLEFQESKSSKNQGEEEEDEEEAMQRATEAQLLRSISHDGNEEETGDQSIEVTGTEGTFHFVSPEACSNSKYDGCAADMWALGCTLYAMVFGTLPFGPDAEGPLELFDAIEGDSLPSWPKEVSAELKDILSQLLAKSPEERLTVEGVLNHPWLQQVQGNNRPELPEIDIDALQPYKSLSMVMMQQEQRRSTGASQSSAGPAGNEEPAVGYNLDESQQQAQMPPNQQQFNSFQPPTQQPQQPPGGYGYPSFSSFDYGVGGDYPGEYQPWYMPIKEPFESPEMNEKWGHVIIRGWLYKRGRMRRSWRRRYVVLCMRRAPNGSMLPVLIYFRNDQIESSENILGSMELQFLTSLGAAPKDQKPYRFFLSTHKRTMYLQALSEEARDMWLESLRDLK